MKRESHSRRCIRFGNDVRLEIFKKHHRNILEILHKYSTTILWKEKVTRADAFALEMMFNQKILTRKSSKWSETGKFLKVNFLERLDVKFDSNYEFSKLLKFKNFDFCAAL